MARPLKDGLDYFPMDAGRDEKMELIEAEFGITGFGVIVKILQKIYRQGYYVAWSKEVALLFSRQIGVGGNVVSEIIAACLKRGIFNRELFEQHGVLTSQEIQQIFFSALKKRKQILVRKQYLLVSQNEFKNLVFTVNSTETPVNSAETTVNSTETPVSDTESTQSKVKKSKVKKSKEERVARDTQTRAQRPELSEVLAYGKSEEIACDPALFFYHYEARNWLDSKGNPVTNWRAALKGWECREAQFAGQARERKHPDTRDPRITADSSLDYGTIDAMIDGQFGGEGDEP